MSPPIRNLVLVLILTPLVVVAVTALRPAPEAPPWAAAREAGYKPFPQRVVATAPRLPEYADGPSTRIRQQLASLETLWLAAFEASGQAYERPEFAERVEDGCAPAGGWAGIYCGGRELIVIDLDGHVRRNAAIGGGLSDLILGYIVAHEVGHHVQALRGAPADVLRRELHADCLAGVWGRAAGLQLPPPWAFGTDADHGTQLQRVQAVNRGDAHARPADCDPLLG